MCCLGCLITTTIATTTITITIIIIIIIEVAFTSIETHAVVDMHTDAHTSMYLHTCVQQMTKQPDTDKQMNTRAFRHAETCIIVLVCSYRYKQPHPANLHMRPHTFSLLSRLTRVHKCRDTCKTYVKPQNRHHMHIHAQGGPNSMHTDIILYDEVTLRTTGSTASCWASGKLKKASPLPRRAGATQPSCGSVRHTTSSRRVSARISICSGVRVLVFRRSHRNEWK